MNRVYKFGCRAPSNPALAEQLLGQAWLYREDLRRAYNADKRRRRASWEDSAHVRAYEAHLAATDDTAHALAHERHQEHEWLLRDVRNVRARRGHLVDWGTYQLIESDVLRASKASGLDPIRSSAFDGTGRIGAFISSTTKFRADRWSHPRVELTTPDARKHACLTIYVGEAKRATKLTWPIKLHRPFPAGAVVTQVAVQRIRNGHRYRWEAIITIDFEPLSEADPGAAGVVGVDVGWRNDGEIGQRVATFDAADDAGVLHIQVMGALQYADTVRSIRDDVFDLTKVRATSLPGCERASQWRDKSRLHLASRKHGEDFPIEHDGRVSPWRTVDRHLEDIESGVRGRALRRRLDAYRVFADRLAKRYRIVALEDMPMADWVGEADTSTQERWRSSAALYVLQLTLAQRFGPGRVDWVPAQYTTMTCARCGVVRKDRVGPATHWRCECGVEHHQDANAAEIIRDNSERWIGDNNPPRARTRKSTKGADKKKRPTKTRVETNDEQQTSRKAVQEAAE